MSQFSSKFQTIPLLVEKLSVISILIKKFKNLDFSKTFPKFSILIKIQEKISISVKNFVNLDFRQKIYKHLDFD